MKVEKATKLTTHPGPGNLNSALETIPDKTVSSGFKNQNYVLIFRDR